MKKIEAELNKAITKMNVIQNAMSVQKVKILEKALYTQYSVDRQKEYLDWLKKLNELDYSHRSRAFFAHLKAKLSEPETLGAVSNKDGILSTTLEESLEIWASFYEDLYSGHDIPKFSGAYCDDTELDRPFSLLEFESAIKSLKNNKTPGLDHIRNEDLSLFTKEYDSLEQTVGCTEALRILCALFNSFWKHEKVPEDLKISILRPFLKDKNESEHDPGNYRPISLLNTFFKVYETLIYTRLEEKLDNLSVYQTAYRHNKSTLDNLLILQELFFEYRFNKVGPRGGRKKLSLFLCFLDFIKAFDKVPREILFKKLYKFGIRGKMFRVIRDLYTNNRARVLINNRYSREFNIKSGVLQGSKLGPMLFIIFLDDLLKSLNASSLGAKVGYINISGLGFADDLLLISDTPDKLQKLILICELWSKINHMAFKISKSKVMVLNSLPTGLDFKLYGKKLDIVKSHRYIGILLSTRNITNIYADHFNLILDRAHKRLWQIKHVGFTKDGLRPETALKLYTLLVRPILEYGGQVLTYTYSYVNSIRGQARGLDEITGFVKKLEHFQTQTLKNLLGAPKSCSPAVIRLFAGVVPFSCRLDLLKLRYFWKKCNSHLANSDISSKLLLYRKQFFLATSNGFIHEVFDLCCKYNLMELWHGNLSNLAGMSIARKVLTYSLASDLKKGRKFSCLFSDIYLSNVFSYQKSYHLVHPFKSFNFFSGIDDRRCIIRLLLYPRSFKSYCPYCHVKYEDILRHFFVDCTFIGTEREKMYLKLQMYNFHREDNNDFKSFVAKCLQNKLWSRCIADFLTDIKFYQKSEEDLLDQPGPLN